MDEPSQLMMKTYQLKNRIIFLAVVATTGALAGSFVWAFFFAMNWGLGLLWETLPEQLNFALFPLVVCLLGGVVIGLAERAFGPLPESLASVMQQVKETGRYRYDNLGRSSICALLPLVFGGSIGPEAGLTGTIAGLCSWVGDRMKRFGAEFQELTRMGTSAALSAIFAAPLFGFVAPFCGNPQDDAEIEFPKKAKIVLYLVAIMGALAPFVLFRMLFGQAGGLPHFSQFSFGLNELIWLVPLLVVGCFAGWLYHGFNALSAKIATLFGEKVVLRAAVAGIVLGGCGVIAPFTMFAGEHQLGVLSETWTTFGLGMLFLIGFLKLFTTTFCINCGWRGGNIFPVIFSGVCLGYAVAQISGCDPVFCIAICAAAVSGAVMRNALMASLLLILCFPVVALPALFLAALVGGSLPIPRTWLKR